MVFASKRAQRVVFATGLALGLLALGACGGGGGSISNPMPQPNQPQTPQGATDQFALNAAGMSVALPSVAGFSETMTFPANNAAAGTNLTVRVTSGEPAGMPKLDPDMHVAIPFLYFTIGTNKDVKLNGFPGFKMTIPAGFNMGNMPVKVGYYDPRTGWNHVGDFTLSGRTVTFTPTSAAVTLKANVTYYAITYTCGGPSPSPTPTGVISCTASGTGAIGVLCITGGSTPKTYAFVGKGTAGGSTVEQIDISKGATASSTGPPAHTYSTSFEPTNCSSDEKHLRVFCSSFFGPKITDINATSRTNSDFSTDAVSGLSFSGGSCTVCALAFDPIDTAFIIEDGIDTPAGAFSGAFQRVGESSHTVDMTILSPDVNENPGYDYVKNWVWNPEYRSGKLEIADFTKGKLFTTSGFVSSLQTPDSGAVDVSTHVAVSPNEGNSVATLGDLGTASESGSTLTITTGSTTLTCFGFGCGLDIDAAEADSVIHTVFFVGEFGTTSLGFASMPTTMTGTTLSDWAFAQWPNTPDGNSFSSGADPHPVAAFNDPNNCPDCAIAVNSSFTWIGVVDLFKLIHAPRSKSDSHTIDPTYDLVKNKVVAFYKI